ncbi:MAG TPA: MlaD family protein [Bryobacteraceae bacterium]|nr:MlaD family protein [Bryobacteraceae bacterium]HZW94729.1 MlaD family protein [Candidatus Eremiobacteraceae bacterium]
MKTEAKVGAFVIVCVAILLATVYRISSSQLKGARDSYRTYLRYAGGLQPGTDVLFGGIKVGLVTAVRPDAQDPTRIEVTLDVKHGTPLNANSVAKLGSVTLVTSPVISISTGSNDAPRLPPGGVIPSQETISVDDTQRKIVALADSARSLLDSVRTEVNNVTGDARVLMANMNQVVGRPNQQHIQNVLANADAMITRLSPKVDQIGDEVAALTRNANIVVGKAGPLLENANGTVSNANNVITKLRDPIQTDLTDIRTTLEEARTLIATLNAATRAKDQNLNEIVDNVRMATGNLNELTDSLKQRPWSLVRIKQPADRKVPK